MDLTKGGDGIFGFAGLTGSLSGSGGGSVSITDNGCTGETEGSGSVDLSATGSLKGGGGLTY